MTKVNYPQGPPETARKKLVELLVERPNRTARQYADEGVLNTTSVHEALCRLEDQGLAARSLEHPEKPHNPAFNQYTWRLTVEVV